MDKKESDAIENIWTKVSEQIGHIFSTLLPGTDAKLEPPEGETYLDG